MTYRQYSFDMDLTGITRKKAAEIIADSFSSQASSARRCKQDSSQAVYDNSNDVYTVKDNYGREWKVEKNLDIERQKHSDNKIVGANFMYDVKIKSPMLNQSEYIEIAKLLDNLERNGSIVNESTKTVINISTNGLNNSNFINNINNSMISKKELLYSALQTNHKNEIDTSLLESDGLISFPIFNSTLDSDTLKAYIHLSAGMTKQAMMQRSIDPRIKETPNPKFTFRTWLIRLGMVGDEFKETRSVFAKNLEGNSAWLNPQINVGSESIEKSIDKEISQNQDFDMDLSI